MRSTRLRVRALAAFVFIVGSVCPVAFPQSSTTPTVRHPLYWFEPNFAESEALKADCKVYFEHVLQDEVSDVWALRENGSSIESIYNLIASEAEEPISTFSVNPDWDFYRLIREASGANLDDNHPCKDTYRAVFWELETSAIAKEEFPSIEDFVDKNLGSSSIRLGPIDTNNSQFPANTDRELYRSRYILPRGQILGQLQRRFPIRPRGNVLQSFEAAIANSVCRKPITEDSRSECRLPRSSDGNALSYLESIEQLLYDRRDIVGDKHSQLVVSTTNTNGMRVVGGINVNEIRADFGIYDPTAVCRYLVPNSLRTEKDKDGNKIPGSSTRCGLIDEIGDDKVDPHRLEVQIIYPPLCQLREQDRAKIDIPSSDENKLVEAALEHSASACEQTNIAPIVLSSYEEDARPLDSLLSADRSGLFDWDVRKSAPSSALFDQGSLRIANNVEELIRSSTRPDRGAQFGFTFNPDDEETIFAFDAAVGYQFSNTIPRNRSGRRITLVPALAIQRNRTRERDGVTPDTITRDNIFASLQLAGENLNAAKTTHPGDWRRPGLRGSGAAEIITDGGFDTLIFRSVGRVSPPWPDRFPNLGFRNPVRVGDLFKTHSEWRDDYLVQGPPRRDQKACGSTSCLFWFSWDFNAAADYVDIINRPRAGMLPDGTFEPVSPIEDIDGFRLGFDAEATISGRTPFSFASSRPFLSLGVEYQQRYGLQRTVGNQDLLDINFTIRDNIQSLINWNISYEIGEDIRSGEDIEQIMFSLGFRQ